MRPALPWIALPAAAALLYAGTWSYPRIFDDLTYALPGGASLHRWLSHETFRLLGPNLALERSANIALHAATAMVLFGFLCRLFQIVIANARGVAFFGALAFAVHPVAVYGVAYLTQRSIIMATLFSLAALWCVLEALQRRSAGWYAGAAALYGLAIFSKEHAVMLPAVALALVYLVRGPSRPLAIAAGATVVSALIALIMARAFVGSAYEPFVQDVGAAAYPLSVLNQASLFFRYLGTWLAPCPCWMSVDLRVAFPRELVGWHTPGLLAFVAYPVAASYLLKRGGAAGLAGFGLLFPWLLALTEFAAVRAQEPFVLYRSYLWMSGLPAALPLIVGRLGPGVRNIVLVAVCLVLAAIARERIETFSDPFKLWDDAVRKNNDVSAPYVERAYINRGDLHRAGGRPRAALLDFDRAIALNPRVAEGYVGRATVRLDLKRPDEALPDLDRALELDPNHASARAKRCFARSFMGFPRADVLAECELARKLRPDDPEIREIDAFVRRRVG